MPVLPAGHRPTIHLAPTRSVEPSIKLTQSLAKELKSVEQASDKAHRRLERAHNEIGTCAKEAQAVNAKISALGNIRKSLVGVQSKQKPHVYLHCSSKGVHFSQHKGFMVRLGLSDGGFEKARNRLAEYGVIIDPTSSRQNAAKLVETFDGALQNARTLKGELSRKLDAAGGRLRKATEKLNAALDNEIRVEEKAELVGVRQVELRSDALHRITEEFSVVYQTNVGATALNREARSQFGGAGGGVAALTTGAVLSEYERVLDVDFFFGGGKQFKDAIKYSDHAQIGGSYDLEGLVRAGAQAFYQPSGRFVISHRGQGMTALGLEQLRIAREECGPGEVPVYRAGQFFSTSTSKAIAAGFADRSHDEVKVDFLVNGHSGRALAVGQLAFDGHENERLYSPLATFAVTSVVRDPSSGRYEIALTEVQRNDQAPPLPY